MDTKSTNSKAYIFTKVIAVLLVVLTLGFSAVQVTKAYEKYEKEASSYFRLSDAVSFKNNENYIYSTYAFETRMENYLRSLARLTYYYGNGSKEAYNAIAKENDYETLKKRFIYNLFYRVCNIGSQYDIGKLLTLCDEEVITMKLVKENEETDGYEEENIINFYNEFSVNGIVSDYTDNIYYSTVWIFSQELEEALKTGSDILIDLEAWNFSYDDDEGIYIKDGIKAGQYSIKINDKKLKQVLVDNDDLSLLTYEQFVKEYNQCKAEFEKEYTNINYIYKDKNGKVTSNIKKLKDVYYLDGNYSLWGKSDNMQDFYGNVYTIEYYDADSISTYRHNDTRHNGSVVTTMLYQPTSMYIEPVTTPEAVEENTTTIETTLSTTMSDVSANTVEFKVSEMENDSYCIFFRMNATFDGVSLVQINNQAYWAKIFVMKLLTHSAICMVAFAFATLILVILCGRKRKGAEEVTFLFSDRIFFEFKTVLNIGLGVVIFFLGANVVDDLSQRGIEIFACLSAAVSLPAIGLLLLDYILYIARHLKAQKFIKSFFVVWFVKVLCVKGIKVIKKIWNVVGKVIKTFFEIIFIPLKKLKEALNSEKLFYAKNVEQTVKIKTAILLAINVPLAFVCFLYMFPFEGIDSWGDVFVILLFAIPTLACDALALIRGLSFVGGVSRIAEVISEYRKGNLDTPINRAGLPSYLIPVGENLEGLGEGIKLAVDEAVKQESTKTELITNISHDLKTPLTSIINYVDLLKKCDIEDETAKSYLEVLGEKSDRLKILITDLVEASKAATGNVEVNLVKISLREILTQLVGEFSDAFAKCNLDVILSVPDSDITASADNKLLYRVLENLAVNIEKYSMEGTRVYISAESNGTKGVIIFKNISKAPLNITPDELKQRFVRGDASRTTDGNGLGLSIAENLCIVQGGSLDIDIVGDLFIAKVELNCR